MPTYADHRSSEGDKPSFRLLPTINEFLMTMCSQPASTVLPFLREREGYRMFGMLQIIGHGGFFLILAWVTSLFGVLATAHGLVPFWRAIDFWPLAYGALLVYRCLKERRARWGEIVQGKFWFTFSRGNSWLRRLLPDYFGKRGDYAERFGDPLLLLAIALITFMLSKVMAVWFIYCALCVFAVEQISADKRLNKMLDKMDNILTSEIDVLELHYLKAARNSESVADALKTAAEDRGLPVTNAETEELQRAIERRRAQDGQAGEQEPPQEEAPEAA